MPSIAETVDAHSITRVHAAHQTILLDYVSGTNPIYVGWAEPSSATSAPLWRIALLTYDGNGNVTALQWAAGNNLYVHIWDDRAGLSYS